jgi:WhiB family redox-sensing transcriptional regulator
MTPGKRTKLHARLRAVAGTGGVVRIGPDAFRLILRVVLFDGEGVPLWRRQAACASTDPGLFYPPDGWIGQVAVEAAKAVCAGCPVRADCLADALAWERPIDRHGVLGGLTAGERARLAHQDTAGGDAA